MRKKIKRTKFTFCHLDSNLVEFPVVLDHHIQVLLADELDHYKNKGDERIENYIKMI